MCCGVQVQEFFFDEVFFDQCALHGVTHFLELSQESILLSNQIVHLALERLNSGVIFAWGCLFGIEPHQVEFASQRFDPILSILCALLGSTKKLLSLVQVGPQGISRLAGRFGQSDRAAQFRNDFVGIH